ncbi:hypothetical protein BGX27_002128 [Mortierella sp. AM989]|nr:hypothetical protein BGX27_002128 [Mortierella sp. AM989]
MRLDPTALNQLEAEEWALPDSDGLSPSNSPAASRLQGQGPQLQSSASALMSTLLSVLSPLSTLEIAGGTRLKSVTVSAFRGSTSRKNLGSTLRSRSLPLLVSHISLDQGHSRFRPKIDNEGAVCWSHWFDARYSASTGDLECLKARPPNTMLVENSGTRQDGAWFFNNDYEGSIAIKLYSAPLSSKIHKENVTSSDIRSSFLQSDGITENEALRNVRKEFKESLKGNRIKGMLRIHLEFSNTKDGPRTHVLEDPVAGTKDVMVYINCSNMDTFFYEGTEGTRT